MPVFPFRFPSSAFRPSSSRVHTAVVKPSAAAVRRKRRRKGLAHPAGIPETGHFGSSVVRYAPFARIFPNGRLSLFGCGKPATLGRVSPENELVTADDADRPSRRAGFADQLPLCARQDRSPTFGLSRVFIRGHPRHPRFFLIPLRNSEAPSFRGFSAFLVAAIGPAGVKARMFKCSPAISEKLER